MPTRRASRARSPSRWPPAWPPAAGGQAAPEARELLEQVADLTPPGPVRDGLRRAAGLPGDTEPWRAADLLGNGRGMRAGDTVPFALWSAAHRPALSS